MAPALSAGIATLSVARGQGFRRPPTGVLLEPLCRPPTPISDTGGFRRSLRSLPSAHGGRRVRIPSDQRIEKTTDLSATGFFYGSGAGIRTPIPRSRTSSPTVRRPPNEKLSQFDFSTLFLRLS